MGRKRRAPRPPPPPPPPTPPPPQSTETQDQLNKCNSDLKETEAKLNQSTADLNAKQEELNKYSNDFKASEAKLNAAQEQLNKYSSDFKATEEKLIKCNADFTAKQDELNKYSSDVKATEEKLNKCNADVTAKQDELNKYSSDFKASESKFNKCTIDFSNLTTSYDSLNTNYNSLNTNYNNLNIDYNKVNTKYNNLNTDYKNLNIDYNNLNTDYKKVTSDYNNTKTRLNNLKDQHNQLTEKYDIKIGELNAVNAEYDSNIRNLYKGLNSGSLNTNDLLIKQKEIINIIKSEQNRLNEKKQSVDNALEGQNRLITLNNSYRMRYAEYIKIIIIIVIFLSIFIGVSLARKYIPFFPEFIYNMTIILLVPICAIAVYYKYTQIISRNRLDYDELDLKPPTMLTDEDKLKEKVAEKANILKSGNLLGGLEGCIGSQCCSGNTIWDSGNSLCVTAPRSGFTTINYALINGELDFRLNDGCNKPYSPSEFDKYTRI
jgi:septal ring factor EnvC (AmiA/AmiB activator)